MTRSIKYLILLVFTVVILQSVSCYTQIALAPQRTISRDRIEQYESWEQNHRQIRYYYPDCFDCFPWDYYYYFPYWYDYDYYSYGDFHEHYRNDDNNTVKEIPSRRDPEPDIRGTAAELPTGVGTTTRYYRGSNSSGSNGQTGSSSSSSSTSRTRTTEDNSSDDDDSNDKDKTKSIPSRRTR